MAAVNTPLFAAAIVLAAAASGSGDYELRLPNETICAKDLPSCEMAQDAISAGRWPIASRETVTLCKPHPVCFSERSNCIPNFSC